MKYIAKSDTWYDEGTEARPITDFWIWGELKFAIFEGIKDGKLDEEVCHTEEFEIRQS